MTMRARAKHDSNRRLLELRVFRKSRKALVLNFLYGSDGLLEDIEFKGDTHDMPSIAEIMALINGNLWNETTKAIYKDTIINRDIDKVGETVLLSAVGLGSCGIQISGTWVGALEFEGTVDGVNWVQARAVQFGGTLVGDTIVNGLFFAQIGGLLRFRIRASAWTNGTATIYLEATAATNAVTLANSLPTGVNSIGQVTANAGTNLNTSLLALEAGGNLATIAGKDFATQTTLALIKAKTDNLDVLLSTRALEAGGNLAALVAKDYATQTTLALLKTRADLLATEATLGTVHGHVDSIDGKITACNTGAIAGTLTQSTKHDAKVYLWTAAGSAADGATVINNVANKVIKIHRMFLQSTVDGATNVYLYEETSGNLVTVNTTLNAREGRESAFVPAPACIGQTTTVNKKVLLKNAAAKQVYWEITYSADDAA